MRTRGDFDWLVVITTVTLIIVGLGLIYSIFHPHQTGFAYEVDNTYFTRQLIWVCLGFVAALIGFAVPLRFFEALG